MGRQKFEGCKSQAAIRLTGLPADGNTITITPSGVGTVPKTYEFDSGGGVTPGNIAVTIGGSIAATITTLIGVINANKPTPGVVAFADPLATDVCRLEGEHVGAAGNHALAKNGANITLSGAAMTDGADAENQVESRGKYIVTAVDDAVDNIMISTGLQSPRFPQVECRSSAGAPKTLSGNITVEGSRIRVANGGGTNPVAGDELFWSAWE